MNMSMVILDAKQLAKAPLDTKVRVLGGQWVPRTLYLRVEKEVSVLIPQLVPGKLYRLSDIYGESRWNALGNAWVKRKAGRCFAHMVSTKRFALDYVKYKRSATKRYRLPTG